MSRPQNERWDEVERLCLVDAPADDGAPRALLASNRKPAARGDGGGPAITELTWAALVLSFDYNYYTGSFLMPIGDPANPTLELVTDFYDLYYEEFLTGYPADGTVYRFTPTGETLGMEAAAQPGVKAWPNPTNGSVRVDFNGQHKWTLTDAVGRVILNGTGQDGVRLDLGNLDAGAYLFRLDNGQVERIVRH